MSVTAYATTDMADVPSASSYLSFFPIVPAEDDDMMPLRILPIISDRPIHGTHSGVTRVIIGIHDHSRNAEGLETSLSGLAGSAKDTVMIMAPHFATPTDITPLYLDKPEDIRHAILQWSADQWPIGGNSISPPAVSSFFALDLILMFLAEKTFFPDLKDIVIVGHGLGADFAQRYAATGIGVNVIGKQDIIVRFVVVNASSYLYFTPIRPRNSTAGFAAPNIHDCAFNDYKYGLENLNPYTKRTGMNAIKTDYVHRDMTYLLSENISANEPYADTSCAAMQQGSNRVTRGTNYMRYIEQIYGSENTTRQQAYVLPKANYDPLPVYGSACGLSVLFGDGKCTAAMPPKIP